MCSERLHYAPIVTERQRLLVQSDYMCIWKIKHNNVSPKTPDLALFEWPPALLLNDRERWFLTRPPQHTHRQSFMRLQRQHSGLCVTQWVRLFSLTPRAHVTKARSDRMRERERFVCVTLETLGLCGRTKTHTLYTYCYDKSSHNNCFHSQDIHISDGATLPQVLYVWCRE